MEMPTASRDFIVSFAAARVPDQSPTSAACGLPLLRYSTKVSSGVMWSGSWTSQHWSHTHTSRGYKPPIPWRCSAVRKICHYYPDAEPEDRLFDVLGGGGSVDVENQVGGAVGHGGSEGEGTAGRERAGGVEGDGPGDRGALTSCSDIPRVGGGFRVDQGQFVGIAERVIHCD
jgi:hypothetical protein